MPLLTSALTLMAAQLTLPAYRSLDIQLLQGLGTLSVGSSANGDPTLGQKPR